MYIQRNYIRVLFSACCIFSAESVLSDFNTSNSSIGTEPPLTSASASMAWCTMEELKTKDREPYLVHVWAGDGKTYSIEKRYLALSLLPANKRFSSKNEYFLSIKLPYDELDREAFPEVKKSDWCLGDIDSTSLSRTYPCEVSTDGTGTLTPDHFLAEKEFRVLCASKNAPAFDQLHRVLKSDGEQKNINKKADDEFVVQFKADRDSSYPGFCFMPIDDELQNYVLGVPVESPNKRQEDSQNLCSPLFTSKFVATTIPGPRIVVQGSPGGEYYFKGITKPRDIKDVVGSFDVNIDEIPKYYALKNSPYLGASVREISYFPGNDDSSLSFQDNGGDTSSSQRRVVYSFINLLMLALALPVGLPAGPMGLLR